MMQKKRRYINHFIYPIGLVSLALLPIMCIWYLKEKNVFRQERLMSISILNDYWEERTFKEKGFRIHPKRNFTDINLTGNEKEDNIKLNFAELEIRELVKTQDTIKGIRFHFDDSAKYWSLIRAIDICDEERAHIWVPKDNDIWVYNIPKPKQTFTIIELLSDGLGSDVIMVNPKINLISEILNDLHTISKNYLNVLILFLAFSITSIILFIKAKH